MAEQTKHPVETVNKETAHSEQKHQENHEHKTESHEHKTESHEHKTETPKEDTSKAKPVKKQVVKKEVAKAMGQSFPASKKVCMYICDYIKGKSIDQAIKELGEVIKYKRIIPYRGEIPHRKGPGMMSGRYPIKASGLFIPLLKGLKGNVIANGMDLDKTRITLGSPNWASRPSRRGGGRFKRTHVLLEAREVKIKENKEKKK